MNVHCLHDVAVVLGSCQHYFGIMLPPPDLNLFEGDGIVHNTASLPSQNGARHAAVMVRSRSGQGKISDFFGFPFECKLKLDVSDFSGHGPVTVPSRSVTFFFGYKLETPGLTRFLC